MSRDRLIDTIWYVNVYLCIWMYGERCTCSWRLTDGISDGERLMTEPRPERGATREALAHLTILPRNFTFPFPTFYKAWKVGFGCSTFWYQNMLGHLGRLTLDHVGPADGWSGAAMYVWSKKWYFLTDGQSVLLFKCLDFEIQQLWDIINPTT